MAEIKHTHGFKIHVPLLLKEIVENGLRENMGVLKVPLSVLQRYLVSISQRAIELNDPILNKYMCEMAIYSVGDPTSEDYDPDMLETVEKLAANQRRIETTKKEF